MRYVSFFSGIGGFELGLSAAGHECVAWSEIDPYACRVYERHWPGLERLGDCRGPSVSVHLRRIARESEQAGPVAGPVLLLECVEAWRRGALSAVLRDLATIGFDAEWFTFCACLVGAPHHRPRTFVVAYPNGQGEPFGAIHEEMASLYTVSRPVPWPDPPTDIRVDDGLPDRSHRLRSLGNAVVPQVVEWIGKRLP